MSKVKKKAIIFEIFPEQFFTVDLCLSKTPPSGLFFVVVVSKRKRKHQ